MTAQTTPQPITVESFTQAMRDAVAERGGDWIYPRNEEDSTWHLQEPGSAGLCRYFLEDGSPACIIGTALHNLGYAPDQVKEGSGARAILRSIGAPVAVQEAAAGAQSMQDVGGAWDDALNEYELELSVYHA